MLEFIKMLLESFEKLIVKYLDLTDSVNSIFCFKFLLILILHIRLFKFYDYPKAP